MFGVSFDTPADNAAFARKHDFPYRLLCDTDKRMAVAYRAVTGPEAGYPDRVTYVLDAQGTIVYAERVTDIAADVERASACLIG